MLAPGRHRKFAVGDGMKANTGTLRLTFLGTRGEFSARANVSQLMNALRPAAKKD
jgi:hypothetical protein